MKNKIKIILGIMIIGLLIVNACQTNTQNEDNMKESTETMEENKEGKTKETENWLTTKLTTVNTDEEITIEELAEKPLLIEPFAVWCPKCTAQQQETKKLHEEVDNEIVSLGLNIDPNEDESKVLSHIKEYGFDWRYTVASPEFTQSLIEEFGNGIVNAPAGPMILVCPDKTYHELDFGFKPADYLKKQVTEKCGE